jgi:hypothetical protein
MSTCPPDLPVQATATNTTGVTFCATSVDHSFCGVGSFPPFATTTVCATGAASGSTYDATLTLPFSFDCYRVTADATGCGGKTTSAPGFTLASGCSFRVTGAPGQQRIAGWSSDLSVEGGRLQVIINGAAPSFPGRGRATGVANLVNGENRVEAVLVETAGKAGLWRIDFGTLGVIAEGSLRVISGEAVLLGASSATFRLSGREGERIVFTFLRK